MGALPETRDAVETGPGAAFKWPSALNPPPLFPATAIRVIEILSREDCEVKQAVGCIQSDPAFAAEILQVANSALYGFSHEIKSVQHASVTLGVIEGRASQTPEEIRARLPLTAQSRFTPDPQQLRSGWIP